MKLPNRIKFLGHTFKRPTKKYFRCWRVPKRERIHARLGHEHKSMSRETKPNFVEIAECCFTDEGWGQTAIAVCFRTGTACLSIEGTDCDGRLESFTEFEYMNGKWTETGSEQRDHTAEAMGY